MINLKAVYSIINAHYTLTTRIFIQMITSFEGFGGLLHSARIIKVSFHLPLVHLKKKSFLSILKNGLEKKGCNF